MVRKSGAFTGSASGDRGGHRTAIIGRAHRRMIDAMTGHGEVSAHAELLGVKEEVLAMVTDALN